MVPLKGFEPMCSVSEDYVHATPDGYSGVYTIPPQGLAKPCLTKPVLT